MVKSNGNSVGKLLPTTKNVDNQFNIGKNENDFERLNVQSIINKIS